MDIDPQQPLEEDYWQILLEYADANYDALDEDYFEYERREDS